MINVLNLKPGERLCLQGGEVAEVVENMEDGMWVMVRPLPDGGQPAAEGASELCHAQDIISVVEKPD